MAAREKPIFSTDKRIRLGIWGLGRGQRFYEATRALNYDIVAGCDLNEFMCREFSDINPDALVTTDDEEFLAADMDAVLVATFCVNHAEDCIRALRAGKHVISEVTAFHTMDEGARLVEEVEKSGLVYNLAENVPFMRPFAYLAQKWREGLFGDLMYAEGEYLHEIIKLQYCWNDPGNTPIEPGHQVHAWRSWINTHYYNTHSFGNLMYVTDTRPVRVVSLPCEKRLPGAICEKGPNGFAGIAPSLISMNNGAVVRNLMGGTSQDDHLYRFWGDRGAAFVDKGKVKIALGGKGHSPRFEVRPYWPQHTDIAEKLGHGGGDFWVLYWFAREILFGEPAYFDVYTAADCTIPGILAVKSAQEGGKPYDVPDFRDPRQREAWRGDRFAQKRYDVEHGAFGKKADPAKTKDFTRIMRDLLVYAEICRATVDWLEIADDVVEPADLPPVLDRFVQHYDAMRATRKDALALIRAFPKSDGARAMGELLDTGEMSRLLRKPFLEKVQKERASIKRKARRKKR